MSHKIKREKNFILIYYYLDRLNFSSTGGATMDNWGVGVN